MQSKMKRILLILLVSLGAVFAKGQTPFTTPNLVTGGNTKITQNKGAGRFDSGLIVAPRFTDTATANLSVVSLYGGMLIRVLDTLWMRNESANAWVKQRGVGGGGAGSVLLYRTVGIDSIYLSVDGTTYAVKDSIGEADCSDLVWYVNTIAELEAYSSSATTVIVTDSLRGGIFNYYVAGLTTDDGVVFDATGKGSGYWRRLYTEADGINVTWWGATGDYSTTTATGTDNTAAIQAAIDFSYNTPFDLKKVFVPPGQYMITQLLIPAGIVFYGAGTSEKLSKANTKFFQKAGSNIDIIRCVGDNVSGRLYWYGQLRDFSIQGSTSSTDGWGISFRNSTGTESSIQDITQINNITIRQCPAGGIEMPDGAIPLFLNDCKIYWNGGPGVHVKASSSTRYNQAINFTNLSGDGNVNGLLYLEDLDKHANVVIVNLKSEMRANNPFTDTIEQQHAIYIDNCDSTAITILGANHISSARDSSTAPDYFPYKPGDLIYLTGAGIPKIQWSGVAIRVRSTDVGTDPVVIEGSEISYRTSNGSWPERYGSNKHIAWVMGQRSIYEGRSSINEGPTMQINGDLPAISLYNPDASANQKQFLITNSSGFFGIRAVDDAGTARTFQTTEMSTAGVPIAVRIMTPKLRIENTEPRLEFEDTSAAATYQSWEIATENSDGSLRVNTKSDDLATSVQGLTFTRNGNQPDGISLRQRIMFSSEAGNATPFPLVVSTTTADTRKGAFFITNNSSATNIDFFDNGLSGQFIVVQVNDDSTTFRHNAVGVAGMLWLKDGINYRAKTNDVLVFIRATTYWREVARTSASGLYYYTATNANYSLETGNAILTLPTITNNRTLTLPDASASSGAQLIIYNSNTDNTKTWTFASTVIDAAGTTVTAIPNLNLTTLISNGTSWVDYTTRVTATAPITATRTANSYLVEIDTTAFISPYDTISLSSRINTKLNISDTATMLDPYTRNAELNASYKAILQTTVNSTIASGTTNYISLDASPTPNATESVRLFVVPSTLSGTLKGLTVALNSAQPGTGSLVFTVRKGTYSGGVLSMSDQAITITVAAGATAGVYTNSSNTLSIAGNDILTVKIVNNASGASATISSVSISMAAY